MKNKMKMKKYITLTIKGFLSLLILFSFSSIVKAADYKFLVITPAKYQAVAEQFIALHENAALPIDVQMRGCYALVEEIEGRYNGEPGEEPAPVGAPAVPTPGPEQYGSEEEYENELTRKIVRFLRGVLKSPEEWVATDPNRPGPYAFTILYNSSGDTINPEEAKFQYLLILGDTGAPGPTGTTLNGVPESWYVWMDPGYYDQDPDADGSWFPTDFFYASPGYEEWTPNLRVGRIPVYDLDAAVARGDGKVTELNVVDEDDLINPWSVLDECDICDSQRAAGGTRSADIWVPGEWETDDTDTPAYELVITADGGGENPAPIGTTYIILDNSETCLTVLGVPIDDGVEAETEADIDDGDSFEIRQTTDEARAIYTKVADYMAEVTALPYPNTAWNAWFRKVVTVGGDSRPGLFSFWDEFVLAQIINEGYFEGNEVTKLRHTNIDNVPTDDDFTVTSLSPYLNDKDCGLLFLLGGDTGLENIFFIDTLQLDDAFIDNTDVFAYTSPLDDRMPIMVSNTAGHGLFDFPNIVPGLAYPSLGAAIVQSALGGAIAFIGSSHSTYSGVTPYFDDGVVKQDRLYNFDELLSYTAKSFHSAPRFLGDMFMGSPSRPGEGPIHDFMASNLDTEGEFSFWSLHKSVWEYTLFGDPALPIPYPVTDPIVTGTFAPSLAFNETTLRNRIPQYESHGIGVDEIPDGGSASTTVNVTSVKPAAYPAVPEVRITRVDIRRDTGEEYSDTPIVSSLNYVFTTANTDPGYYFVKVEQPGYDNTASDWGSWFGKETWICVQEVNEFVPTTNNILVVDDDWGFPIVTYSDTYGYEDWYLKSLETLGEPFDIWHVDYDDDLFNVISPPEHSGDDWVSGTDMGDALMHGEVYQGLLDDYGKVIWLTGNPDGYWHPVPYQTEYWLNETITQAEQNYLMDYLDLSGRLFLSGQSIIADLECEGYTEGPGALGYCYWLTLANEFLSDYIHLSAVYAAWSSIHGRLDQLGIIAGNPMLETYGPIHIAGIDGAENQVIWNDAEPDTGAAERIFAYDFDVGEAPTDEIGDPAYPFIGTGGTCYYRGVGANIFLPWGFESIDKPEVRDDIMAAVLGWLHEPTMTGEGDEDDGDDGDGDDGDGDDGDGDGDGDDDVSGGGGDGGSLHCFIATACYGTPMTKEVKILREFRDDYLLKNSAGRFFVRNYYRYSPKVAEYISERPMLKKLVRFGLKPLVNFSEILPDK